MWTPGRRPSHGRAHRLFPTRPRSFPLIHEPDGKSEVASFWSSSENPISLSEARYRAVDTPGTFCPPAARLRIADCTSFYESSPVHELNLHDRTVRCTKLASSGQVCCCCCMRTSFQMDKSIWLYMYSQDNTSGSRLLEGQLLHTQAGCALSFPSGLAFTRSELEKGNWAAAQALAPAPAEAAEAAAAQ